MTFDAQSSGASVGEVLNIYNRHRDEFTESMTYIPKVRTCINNKEIHYIKVRAFSALALTS